MIITAIFLASVIHLKVLSVAAQQMQDGNHPTFSALFSVRSGYRLINKTVTTLSSSHRGKCAVHCLRTPGCQKVYYNQDTQECVFYPLQVDHPSSLAVLVQGLETIYMQLISEPPEWILAFRAQKETGLDVWAAWVNDSQQDDVNALTLKAVPDECLLMTSEPTCDRIFKSQMLDQWVNIWRVQIAFFKDNVRVAYITFDATQVSNKMDFFRPEFILDSSMPSLNFAASKNCSFFDTRGMLHHDRHFYACRNHGGCDNDAGWLTVMTSARGESCSWTLHKTYPVFMYSKDIEATAWDSGDYGSADVFAVFLQMSAG